jgi:small subunit ribosomal protein S21
LKERSHWRGGMFRKHTGRRVMAEDPWPIGLGILVFGSSLPRTPCSGLWTSHLFVADSAATRPSPPPLWGVAATLPYLTLAFLGHRPIARGNSAECRPPPLARVRGKKLRSRNYQGKVPVEPLHPRPFASILDGPSLPGKTNHAVGVPMVKLVVRDRESIQEAVRRFRKLVERSGIKKEMRRREYYEKPSETKRRNKLRAERRGRHTRMLKTV